MEGSLRKAFTLLLVCSMAEDIYSAVSGTACDPTTNGAAVCEAVDANAECLGNTATNCACKSGYKEGSQDSNTCVPKSVSETDCDPASTDATIGGAAICKAVDANAECPGSDKTKCACKSGYKEGSPDSNTCVLKSVSETDCNPTNGGAAVCKAVDANAECPGTAATKCACKSGYKEGSPDSHTCVPKSVSETDCNPTNGGAAVCKAVDANAECPGSAATKCACKSGYKEGSPDSHTCVLKPVTETDCDPTDDDAATGGAAVCKAVDENAECPAEKTKCACKSGYKEDTASVNTCVKDPKSSATSVLMTTSMIQNYLLIYVLKLIY